MPSNYKANDPYVNEQVDLDDILVQDAWLVDQFVGGTLFTWGRGNFGQLGNNGNGVSNLYSSPIQIGSLNNWKQVACGNWHTTLIKTDGTIWSCGYNIYGNLGNGTTVNYSSPIQIGSLTNWKQVACAHDFTAAIKTDGTLWAWGYNGRGSIGNGTATHYSSPVQVGSLNNWKQVAAAGLSYTAAIKTDGTLWTWGYNNRGQLGNGTTINYSSPIQIGLMTNWNKVFNGYDTTIAIKTDGTLWAWGYNVYGALGNGTTIYYSSPIQVGSLTNWKQISVGQSAIIAAIKTDGTLWTWGYGGTGQIGNGTTLSYSSPIQVGSMTNWKYAATGENFAAAIKTDGTLWTWGTSSYGKLGNGTTLSYSSPIQVGLLTNWKFVSPGQDQIAAITFRDLG